MIWFIVMHLFSILLDWVRIGQLTEQEKDLEILLLRQQLGIAQRKLNKPKTIQISLDDRLGGTPTCRSLSGRAARGCAHWTLFEWSCA